MKRRFGTIVLTILLLTFPLSPFAQEKPPAWSVYFSPKGGCTEAIIRELDKAKTTILVHPGQGTHPGQGDVGVKGNN